MQSQVQPAPFDFNKTVTNFTNQLNNMKRTHGRVMGELNQNITETVIKQYDQIIQLVNPIVVELDRQIRENEGLKKELAKLKPETKKSATETSDEAAKKK